MYNLLIEKVESSDIADLIMDFYKVFNKKEERMFNEIEHFLKINNDKKYNNYTLKTPYRKTLFFRDNFSEGGSGQGDFYCLCGTHLKNYNKLTYNNKSVMIGNECKKKFFFNYLSKEEILEIKRDVVDKKNRKRCKKERIVYNEYVNNELFKTLYYIKDVKLTSISNIFNGDKKIVYGNTNKLFYPYKKSYKMQPLCKNNTNKFFFNLKCNFLINNPNVKKIMELNKYCGINIIQEYNGGWFIKGRYKHNNEITFKKNKLYNIKFYIEEYRGYPNVIFEFFN